MKKICLPILLIVFFSASMSAQNSRETDSMAVMKTVQKLFKVIDDKNEAEFIPLSSEKIYCLPCSEAVDSKHGRYIVERSLFYKKYLPGMAKSEDYKKAKASKKIFLLWEENTASDVVVFFTTWLKDELQPGHEGAQLGIHFKRKGSSFIFSAVETVP